MDVHIIQEIIGHKIYNISVYFAITLQIIKYLLSLSEKSTKINTLNNEGLISMDTLEQCPREFISQHILTEGVEKSENAQTH